ncbi:MAG: putative DnaJ subfamily C member 21, partial [Streblomastix strix]
MQEYTGKDPWKILDIEPGADEQKIKKAYRKMALRFHPDKNMDNPERAAEAFKRVQDAYERLMDPAQRKWLKEHKDEINQEDEVQEENLAFPLDVGQYTTSACFNGFDDQPNSFYSVYNEAFRLIAQWDGCIEAAPQFGKSTSDAASVTKFYKFWKLFRTKRTFSWKDVFDTRRAENRFVRRAMQKDNEKERQAAK